MLGDRDLIKYSIACVAPPGAFVPMRIQFVLNTISSLKVSVMVYHCYVCTIRSKVMKNSGKALVRVAR